MNKSDLRIVFLGTPEFAVESLDRIVNEGYNVVGVVTMPDKPAGRGHKMYQSPVKEYALAHNLPLLQPTNLKDPAFVEQLCNLNANLFIVIAFRMLPEVVWTMPELGTFNLHASLLPRYRGAAPINWAVINGDTETGVTTFFLKHEIDTGDILRQERIDIKPTDNVGDIHDRLMHLGAELTLDTIRHIIAGDLQPISQDKLIGDTQPTPAPKIFKDTCHIDWTRTAEQIHNLVRGLSPYPGAWTELYDKNTADSASLTTIKIFETTPLSQEQTQAILSACQTGNRIPDAGTTIVTSDKLYIMSGVNRLLEIHSLQPSGKRRMSTAEFLRGARLQQILTAR